MRKLREAGYNERLFSSGFRRRFHLSRFLWLLETLRRVEAPCRRVLELGCFDGRSISYLPERPTRYVGLDANWEGGLDLAGSRWPSPTFRFEKCKTPGELRELVSGENFDTAICMETLEHVPPEAVAPYIREIARVTTGHFVVTVPNEKGTVFLAKWVVKRLFGNYRPYTPRELWGALTGQMELVERNQHKGFDYDVIVRTIAMYFGVTEVSGYPFRHLPTSANFGVGIVGRARQTYVF